MRSRTTVMSLISPVYTFLVVKTTEVPGLPFIFVVHSAAVRPCTGTPSMAVISSPQRKPSLSAGEPL